MTKPLVFKHRPNTKNPINLVFGSSEEPPAGEREHTASAVISFYEFNLFTDAYIDYGINENAVSSEFSAPYGNAVSISQLWEILYVGTDKIDQSYHDKWQEAANMAQSIGAQWGNINEKIHSRQSNTWSPSGNAKMAERHSKWNHVDQTAANSADYWQGDADAYGAIDVIKWNKTELAHYDNDVRFGEQTTPISGHTAILWGKLGARLTVYESPNWSESHIITACGKSKPWPTEPPTLPERPSIWRADLVFCKPLNNKNPIILIFGDECDKPQAEHSVPNKDTYIMQNTVEVFRADNGEKISIFSANIGASRADYLWSGDLAMPLSMLPKIKDAPLVRVKINQLEWLMRIEESSINEKFNSSELQVSIVSPTRELRHIPAYANTAAQLASNIAASQVFRDDLDTGFKVDFRGQDWSIPEKLIDFDVMNALDVINRIAATTGDTVASMADSKGLIVKDKYPQSDAVFSAPKGKLFNYDHTKSESDYFNSVIVSGENIGVTATAKMGGTAGEKMAPQIIDRLITEEPAARRAALNTLYNSSDYQTMISAEMALFKEMPLLYPSDKVMVGDEVMVLDEIDVSASLQNDALVINVLLNGELLKQK